MGTLRSVNLMVVSMVILFVAGVLTASSYAAIDPGTVVGMWLFEEGDGQVAADSSDNGNDAEFQVASAWGTGKFGEAAQFNGQSYFAAPDSDSLDINGDQMSIVVWVNGENWPGDSFFVRKIATQGTGTIYYIEAAGGRPCIGVNTEAGGDTRIEDSQTVLPANEWIHVALVYDGSELRLYVNGELDGSKPLSGDVVPSEGELRFGRGEPKGYLTGAIDEVAIFASALTAEDIQEIMDVGLLKTSGVEPMSKLPTVWAAVKTAH